MGGILVQQVISLEVVGRLPEVAHRSTWVLVVMASVARDKGPDPALYFGGWEYLALALGYRKYTPTAERAVARCVAELVAAGLLRPMSSPYPRNRQAYRITLPHALPDPL